MRRPVTIHIYAAIAEEESRENGYLVRAAIALAKANAIVSRDVI
jgi:hypothetical protein